MLKFAAPPCDDSKSMDELDALRAEVRRALGALEEGKQVVAYNLLKIAVEK